MTSGFLFSVFVLVASVFFIVGYFYLDIVRCIRSWFVDDDYFFPEPRFWVEVAVVNECDEFIPVVSLPDTQIDAMISYQDGIENYCRGVTRIRFTRRSSGAS